VTEQLLSIPFALSLDEGTRRELVSPQSGALALQNTEQAHQGAVSKTLGYEALPSARISGAARSAGVRLLMHGDRMGTIDGAGLDLYVENEARSQRVDNVPPFTMRRRPIFAPRGGFDPALPPSTAGTRVYACAWYDFAVVGDVGVCCYSWLGAAGKTISYAIWSVSEGTVVAHADFDVTASVYPNSRGHAAQVVACGTTIAIFAEDGTANTIKGLTLDATSLVTAAAGWTPFFGAPGATIVNDWDEGDFAVCSDGSKLYLVYGRAAPDMNVVRLSVALAIEQQSAAANPILAALSAVACDVGFAQLWVLGSTAGSTAPGVILIDPANVAVPLSSAATCAGGPTPSGLVDHLGIKVLSATDAWTLGTAHGVAGEVGDGWCGRRMNFVGPWPGVWTPGAVRQWPSLGSLSAPFAIGGSTYAWTFQSGSPLYAASFWGKPRVVSCVALDEVLPGDDATQPLAPVVALPAPRLMPYAGAYLPANGSLPVHPAQRCFVDGTIASMLLPRVTNALALVFDWVEIERLDPLAWLPVHMGGTTALSGAVLTETDGARVTETNFCHRPVADATGVPPAAAGLTGTFSYVAIFEDTTAAGEVVWSAPSDPSTLTVAAKDISLVVSTLALSRRRRARIVIYRTDDGGSTYYRVASALNDPNAVSVSFLDALGDADLRTRQRLYGLGALPTTAGASQPRQAPAGLRAIARHGDRLVGIADDRATVVYSAPLVAGESRWFSDVFAIPIDTVAPLTALASQDGTLLVFSEREVWAINGDGPPESGGNGTEFSPPRRLSGDVGCIEPRSIVTTSAGTFFQARGGIYIVTRALSVEWIGRAVQDTIAAYPIIRSATLDQARAVVLFTAAYQAQHVGIAYDLALKAWSTETQGTYPVDAVMARVSGEERYARLSAAGVVHRRKAPTSGTAYLDGASTWRTMRASTGWFKVAGIAGEGEIARLDLVFSRETACDLTIDFYYNDDETSAQTITRTAADLLAANGRLDILPARRRCRTFRVTIADASPSGGAALGTGAGLSLYVLAIGYNPMGGPERRPNASR
jgi:hypothetical protein